MKSGDRSRTLAPPLHQGRVKAAPATRFVVAQLVLLVLGDEVGQPDLTAICELEKSDRDAVVRQKPIRPTKSLTPCSDRRDSGRARDLPIKRPWSTLGLLNRNKPPLLSIDHNNPHCPRSPVA